MAAPTEHGNVIILAVADDTIATGRNLILQSIYAKGAVVVTDGAGNVVADLLAGASVSFPEGLPINGLNATGTGPAYIYMA